MNFFTLIFQGLQLDFKLLIIVLFLGIILWKGASRFNGERGVCFSDWEGFIFKWGVCTMGGITFDVGGGSKKIVGCGHPPHGPTPLWETLYMENFMQIMDDSKQ